MNWLQGHLISNTNVAFKSMKKHNSFLCLHECMHCHIWQTFKTNIQYQLIVVQIDETFYREREHFGFQITFSTFFLLYVKRRDSSYDNACLSHAYRRHISFFKKLSCFSKVHWSNSTDQVWMSTVNVSNSTKKFD